MESGPALSRVHDEARLAAVRTTGLLDTPSEESFDRLARMAALLLDAPFAFVTLVDDQRSYWKSRIGIPEDGPRQNTVEESFCQYVVETGEAFIIPDTRADARTSANPSIEEMGVLAWAGYPLRAPGGATLGSFCVVDTVVREWTERDVLVLETLAAAASSEVALRDAALRATEARAQAVAVQERLRYLDEIGELLADTADTDQAISRLAERMVPLLGDWCLITVVDEATGRFRDAGCAHRDPSRLDEVRKVAQLHEVSDHGPTAAAIRTGAPVVTALDDAGLDASTPDPAARAALHALAPAAAAVYPLLGHGDPFGAITLLNGAERGMPTTEELLAAHETARRAGIALENARLRDRQVGIAEALQHSLLTSPPRIDGLEIAVGYRAARTGAHVGGDWYDAFLGADGSLMLVIGDVVGHDLQAVTVMGQLRTVMRSISYDRGAAPGELLTRVDNALPALGVRSLATALVISLQLTATEGGGLCLTFSSAGHPLPLLVDADGTSLSPDGEPDRLLGVDPSRPRRDHHAVLQRGQTLLMMTDGLFERRDLDYDDSLDQLRERVVPLVASGPQAMCDELLAEVSADHGDDDRALLAVRYTG